MILCATCIVSQSKTSIALFWRMVPLRLTQLIQRVHKNHLLFGGGWLAPRNSVFLLHEPSKLQPLKKNRWLHLLTTPRNSLTCETRPLGTAKGRNRSAADRCGTGAVQRVAPGGERRVLGPLQPFPAEPWSEGVEPGPDGTACC